PAHVDRFSLTPTCGFQPAEAKEANHAATPLSKDGKEVTLKPETDRRGARPGPWRTALLSVGHRSLQRQRNACLAGVVSCIRHPRAGDFIAGCAAFVARLGAERKRWRKVLHAIHLAIRGNGVVSLDHGLRPGGSRAPGRDRA